MGNKTGIEWTDATWNPWRGCHKVSAGCKNCYMFREQTRYGNDPNVVVRSKTTFNAPLKWKEPRMIFTCSWSDFFIEEADEWRDEAWEIIRKTPQHTYQILTKRPERIAHCLPKFLMPENVWLGVSVESQDQINRIPILLQYPASIKFLSCEPLLSSIYIDPWLAWRDSVISSVLFPVVHPFQEFFYKGRIDWVIVGGESGPNCREMKLEWAVDIVRQCKGYDVPVFVKQLGGWPDKRNDINKFPEDLRVREYPEIWEVSHDL